MPTKKKKATERTPEEKAPASRPVHHIVEVVEVIETDGEEKEVKLSDGVPDMVNEGVDEMPESTHDEEEEVSVEAAAPEEPSSMKIREPLEDVASPVEKKSSEAATTDDVARKEMVDELFAETPKHEVRERSEEPPTVMPEITMHKKRSVMPIFLWAAIVIVVAALTGGGLLMLTGGTGGLAGFTSEPTPTPTVAPTPTPTPLAVARDEVTVEVQNGSGEAGVAGTMKALLEEKGYTVEKTGNADNYEYTETEIHVKADKADYLDTLKEDLAEAYTVGVAEADLDEDAPYDVRVIVGAE